MGRWDEQLDRSDPQAILSIRLFLLHAFNSKWRGVLKKILSYVVRASHFKTILDVEVQN